MTSAYRSNRKASDEDLLKYNNLGLSLGSIANIIGCHHSTVTHRLKALSAPVADTRRAFMEDIYNELTQDQKEFLIDAVGLTTPVKEYVTKLIIEDFLRSK